MRKYWKSFFKLRDLAHIFRWEETTNTKSTIKENVLESSAIVGIESIHIH